LFAEIRGVVTTGAIAIFVKTVGLSPIKTRLAKSIGQAAAETFHTLSAQAVAAVVRQASERTALTPYWAVAEQKGVNHPAWQTFPQVFQGEGELGTRLASVYSSLHQNHDFVLLLGADAPQITATALSQAATWASRGAFVLGPATDGGFWLFGGRQKISRSLWERVPYSDAQTANVLSCEITRLGKIQQLPTLFDIDTVQELKQLQAQWATHNQPRGSNRRSSLARSVTKENPELCPEQIVLWNWLNHLLPELER